MLTGYAGTGKTYALSEIIKRFPHATVCAPTNKAGIVLRDAVYANTGRMINVKTVSALTQKFSHEVVSDEEEVRRAEEKARREKHTHALPVGNSTSELVFEEKLGEGERLIICDEASMLNTETADRLAEAAYFTLFVGDPFQLPPVDGEQFLSEDPDQSIVVMKELVRSPDIHINTFGLEIRQGRPFGKFIDRFYRRCRSPSWSSRVTGSSPSPTVTGNSSTTWPGRHLATPPLASENRSSSSRPSTTAAATRSPTTPPQRSSRSTTTPVLRR